MVNMSGKRRKTPSKRGGQKGGASISTTKTTTSPARPQKKLKNFDLGTKNDDEDDDEIVDSDDEDDEDGWSKKKAPKEHDSSSEEEETVDMKRVRMAKEYLKKLEAASDDSSSDEEDDDHDDTHDGRDRLSVRLQKERLKRQGTLERAVADHVRASLASSSSTTTTDRCTYLTGHDLTVTCVGLQSSGAMAISGSKDNSVILWDVETQSKQMYLCPHWRKNTKNGSSSSRSHGQVLSAACSDDGRYAVVGRRDASVMVFDIRTASSRPTTTTTEAVPPSPVTVFKGHKGPVTALAFRTLSNQLFSGSEDRCIRHYSLDDMTYMETLYGHQAGVTGLDCHTQERPISVGRDRTARAWKLLEDTHLIFRAGAKVPAADAVAMLRDDWFVSGHENGHLNLWLTDKKKAVASIEHTHGDLEGRCGITALGALKGGDLVASGSSDGYLRLWKVMMGLTLDERGMEPIGEIPVAGYINDIAVGPKARFAVVAVGQEPAMGRWNRVPNAKNRFGIIQLRTDDQLDDSNDESMDETPTIRNRNDNEDSSDDEV